MIPAKTWPDDAAKGFKAEGEDKVQKIAGWRGKVIQTKGLRKNTRYKVSIAAMNDDEGGEFWFTAADLETFKFLSN